MSEGSVIVAGLGEVGKPLFNILSRRFSCIGIDIKPAAVDSPCSVLHVCYPFQIPDFVATTVTYIARFRPELTIINSTIAVGTTREIQDRVDTPVVFSPVRGKHARMEQDMLRYQKFVAGFERDSTERASRHFAAAGFKTACFSNPEAGEVSKLIETTWLGILVGWAQEIDRLSLQCGGSFDDADAFIREIDYLPKNIFPGYIGGHCVMPNIAILREQFHSDFLDAVVSSNDEKASQNEQAEPAAAKRFGNHG